MKHSKHHDNARNTGPRLEPVRFEFTHPTASTVCVAGTFNDWHAEAKPMHRLSDGRWLKETVLLPGTYEYCLVVDGKWMPDHRYVIVGLAEHPQGGEWLRWIAAPLHDLVVSRAQLAAGR